MTTERKDKRQRNVVLGPELDAILDKRAALDGISANEAIKRAIRTREDILAMAAEPSRLARVRDPAVVLPPGADVLVFAGGY